MTPQEEFLQAVTNMENALANVLNNAVSANSNQLERLLKLIIKKEIVLEFLLEDVFPPNGNGLECPCKYRLGISGNAAEATVTVTDSEGNEMTFTGTINFSAEQCFTGGPNCNPSVDNFEINFGDTEGNEVNLTDGRRGTIFCVDSLIAGMQNGTAQGEGVIADAGDFSVDFTYTINPLTDTATVNITATGEDGTLVETTFTADVSPQTFIGDCEDTVGGGG